MVKKITIKSESKNLFQRIWSENKFSWLSTISQISGFLVVLLILLSINESSAHISTEAPSEAPTSTKSSYYWITTVAGNGNDDSKGTGGAPTSASFRDPMYIWGDTMGYVYVTERSSGCVRKFTSTKVYDFAGICDITNGPTGDGGPATSAGFQGPIGVMGDSQGTVYITDDIGSVRSVSPYGIIETFAGTNDPSTDFDDGNTAATSRAIGNPYGVWVDIIGNVYITSFNSGIVFGITNQGVISIAGGGELVT